MARKDVTTRMVMSAVYLARGTPWFTAWDLLGFFSGECSKVCIAAISREIDRGLLTYGVNICLPFFTEKGMEWIEENLNEGGE